MVVDALSYSLGPLEQAVSKAAPTDDPGARPQMSLLANDVRAFIERTHTDTGAQVRSALTRIEKVLQNRAGQQTVTIVPGGTAPIA